MKHIVKNLLPVVILFASGILFAQTEIKLTASDGAQMDFFGTAVAMDGSFAAIGAPRSDNENGNDAGAVYIFKRQSDGSWNERQKLLASDGADGDRFGGALSMSGKFMIAGAQNHAGSGSAYIFERTGGVWSETAKLTASDGQAGDQFGVSVAMEDDIVVIGASGDDDNDQNAGSAYIFQRDNDGTWHQVQKLLAGDDPLIEHIDDLFGGSVAVCGDEAAVGAEQHDFPEVGSGAVYIFTRNNGAWSQTQKLDGPPSDNDVFGSSLVMSAGRLVVGSRFAEGGYGSDAGKVYIFELNENGTWLHSQGFEASDAGNGWDFGTSVELAGNLLVTGAARARTRRYDNDDTGAVYLHRQESDGLWNEVQKIIPTGASAAGQDVAFADNLLLIGDSSDHERGNFAGAAYVFEVVTGFCDDFGDGAAEGWSPLNADSWTVAQDQGSFAYFLQDDNNPDNPALLGEYAIFDEFVGAHFSIQCLARSAEDVASSNRPDVALVYEFYDDQNYSYVVFNKDKNFTRIAKVVDGVRTILATSDGSVPVIQDDDYHILKVTRKLKRNVDFWNTIENRIEVFYDGKLVMTAKDPEPLPGRYGVGSKNDRAYFDMVNVNDICGQDIAVPVELTAFRATAREEGVQLLWQTASESNNFGFEV
ncbi:MAG: hypothetical protein ACE5IR_27985, partial [bacterium]